MVHQCLVTAENIYLTLLRWFKSDITEMVHQSKVTAEMSDRPETGNTLRWFTSVCGRSRKHVWSCLRLPETSDWDGSSVFANSRKDAWDWQTLWEGSSVCGNSRKHVWPGLSLSDTPYWDVSPVFHSSTERLTTPETAKDALLRWLTCVASSSRECPTMSETAKDTQ